MVSVAMGLRCQSWLSIFFCHFIVLQGRPYDEHYIHGEDEERSAQALTSPPPLPLMHGKYSY